jgi:2-keto-4-pentenoate hydratase
VFKNKHVKVGFDAFEHGIIKRRQLVGQTEEDDDWKIGHPLVMPHTMYVGGNGIYQMQIRVPIDDTHTWAMFYSVHAPEGAEPVEQMYPVDYEYEWIDEKGNFIVDYIEGQDVMAWVSQGLIADRTRENITKSDVGVIAVRRMFRDCIELVKQGRDPVGVIRHEHDLIELPLERLKFGRGAEFATQWIDRGSMRYSPQADDLRNSMSGVGQRLGVDPVPAPGSEHRPLHWASYLNRPSMIAARSSGSRPRSVPLDRRCLSSRALIAARVAAGDDLAGAKLGLTSVAKQGRWAPNRLVGARSSVSALPLRSGRRVIPRIEPEFVFLMGSDLEGPDCTADDVLDATERVVGGIEVIDSRYEAFKFTLPDVIADNTSAARVAIGRRGVAPRDVDLRRVECEFTIDGAVTGRAAGEALLGSPAECVALLVRHLARTGRGVQAGWLVMAGAPLDARPFGVGTFATASYSHFGDVTVRGV